MKVDTRKVANQIRNCRQLLNSHSPEQVYQEIAGFNPSELVLLFKGVHQLQSFIWLDVILKQNELSKDDWLQVISSARSESQQEYAILQVISSSGGVDSSISHKLQPAAKQVFIENCLDVDWLIENVHCQDWGGLCDIRLAELTHDDHGTSLRFYMECPLDDEVWQRLLQADISNRARITLLIREDISKIEEESLKRMACKILLGNPKQHEQNFAMHYLEGLTRFLTKSDLETLRDNPNLIHKLDAEIKGVIPFCVPTKKVFHKGLKVAPFKSGELKQALRAFSTGVLFNLVSSERSEENKVILEILSERGWDTLHQQVQRHVAFHQFRDVPKIIEFAGLNTVSSFEFTERQWLQIASSWPLKRLSELTAHPNTKVANLAQERLQELEELLRDVYFLELKV